MHCYAGEDRYYILYELLWPRETYITQESRWLIVDTQLTLMFKISLVAYRYCPCF